MTREALATLLHPFEADVLETPGDDARVLFLGAEPGFVLPDGFGGKLTLVQGFRPHFSALVKAGHDVSQTVSGECFTAALVLCGRHRGLNELRVADALERTGPGALIVVAGGKEDGVASLRKRLSGSFAVEGSLSKYHGVALWLRRPADPQPAIEALRAENGSVLVEGRFTAAPGMFSHDRVDAGSKLLAQHLPAELAGKVADFCAGWGYLAVEVAERCRKVKSLDLYEADFASLEAARANLGAALAGSPAAPTAGFYWHDLVVEPVAERYDAIVMNPPFHTGRAAEPGLGQALIGAAARALKPGGQLLVVANRQLPYEASLSGAFSAVQKLAEDQGFKVLRAKR
ncbi:class I SAM-dependent methyltransferase [Arvimicrobium flavum]|uniref:class I SAM-dependent methyltransferase n=1 Tax=Arvimicrobium flavum TaxID=3393320 RepID=UPI00237B32D9|nr:class I SAM-dependent methyltransferase [Mesorhizobium shangrilense]